MSNSDADKKPDFNLFVDIGKTDKPVAKQIGRAWKHENGDGFSIELFAHPIGGKAVAFAYSLSDEEDDDLDQLEEDTAQ